ncbi:hypothetical protein ACUMUG_003528, partial [Escherichia coli]
RNPRPLGRGGCQQVIDEKVVLLVISVGKREGSDVYHMADTR